MYNIIKYDVNNPLVSAYIVANSLELMGHYKDTIYGYNVNNNRLTLSSYIGAYDFNSKPHNHISYHITLDSYYLWLYRVQQAGYVIIRKHGVNYLQLHRPRKVSNVNTAGLKGKGKCFKCGRSMNITMNTPEYNIQGVYRNLCKQCAPVTVNTLFYTLCENALKLDNKQALEIYPNQVNITKFNAFVKRHYKTLSLLTKDNIFYLYKGY